MTIRRIIERIKFRNHRIEFALLVVLSLISQSFVPNIGKPVEAQESLQISVLDLIKGGCTNPGDIDVVIKYLETQFESSVEPFAGRLNNGDTWTPLTAALECDHFAVAAYLLASGANASTRTKRGYSPIWIISNSRNGNTPDAIATCAILVNNNVDVEAFPEKQADPPMEMRPLHVATLRGNVDIVYLLVKANANPNARDTSGKSPLDYAFAVLDKLKRTGSSKASIDNAKRIIDILSKAGAVQSSREAGDGPE